MQANKSLYGLKQASRAWYQKMDQALLSIHFKRLQTDACVYVLRDGDMMMFVALYVDDLTSTIQLVYQTINSQARFS